MRSGSGEWRENNPAQTPFPIVNDCITMTVPFEGNTKER
jgi:hypothetical protein